MDTACAAAGKPQKTAFLHLAKYHQGKLSVQTKNAVLVTRGLLLILINKGVTGAKPVTPIYCLK